ncbi:MAG: OmpA family protein [Nitrospiraceae bacterium]
MTSRHIHPWAFATLSLILLTGQGCSMKWIQSGSESEGHEGGLAQYEKSRQRGGTAADREGGSLKGLDPLVGGQVASEERLGGGTLVAKEQPSDRSDRKLAELRREEAAAMAAGLKDVFFGYDEWNIPNEGMKVLTHDAAWLKGNPKAILKIEGHCDERGSHDYNLVLGEKRSKAVRNFLANLGVNPKQLAIVSYGKERPFCFDRNESCYQQNRRGHMLLRDK